MLTSVISKAKLVGDSFDSIFSYCIKTWVLFYLKMTKRVFFLGGVVWFCVCVCVLFCFVLFLVEVFGREGMLGCLMSNNI